MNLLFLIALLSLVIASSVVSFVVPVTVQHLASFPAMHVVVDDGKSDLDATTIIDGTRLQSTKKNRRDVMLQAGSLIAAFVLAMD